MGKKRKALSKSKASAGAPAKASPDPQKIGGVWDESWPTQQEEMEARVKRNPHEALDDALKLLDYSIGLLEKLIKSGAFAARIVRRTDGSGEPIGSIETGALTEQDSDNVDLSWDAAVTCLSSRFGWLVEIMSAQARLGNDYAIMDAWRHSKRLTEVIHALAETHPELVIQFARDSLFLPSLRAKSKTFTHDFTRVAKAIHLSDECIVNMAADALHQLDSPATRLVAEILEEISLVRRHERRDAESLKRWEALVHESPNAEYREFCYLCAGDFMSKHYPSRQEILGYLKLPPFNEDTVKVWWDNAVKPFLEKPETMNRIRGTRFYGELVKATESGKDYEVRDELKRRCKPKVESLAPPVSAKHPPS